MKYVVSVSGGLGSAEALKRTIDKYGHENTRAVFCDVKGQGRYHFWSQYPAIDDLLHERFGGESHDTYRFLFQLSHLLDINIERLETTDTIWNVFARRKALRLVLSGGVFFCPASEELKRWQYRNYLQSLDDDFRIVLGMGWDEPHRVKSSAAYWSKTLGRDVQVIAPCAVKPYADNAVTMAWLAGQGVEVPSAYALGMLHNNCYGGCVQQGQAGFANLYATRPGVYWYWAYMERRLQEYIGKGYTVLKDERGGVTTPMSLYDYAERIETGDYTKGDWGGCGCFAGNADVATFLAQAEIKLMPKGPVIELPAQPPDKPMVIQLALF